MNKKLVLTSLDINNVQPMWMAGSGAWYRHILQIRFSKHIETVNICSHNNIYCHPISYVDYVLQIMLFQC